MHEPADVPENVPPPGPPPEHLADARGGAVAPTPAPVHTIVAANARRNALFQLVFSGAIVIGMAMALLTTKTSADMKIILVFGVLIFLAALRTLKQPPRVEISGTSVRFGGVRTWIGNVQSVAYDGVALRVVFDDISGFQPPQARRALEQAIARTGSHLVLPWFSQEQVDEVRRLLGLSAPPPETQAGHLEQFARVLVQQTPRLWATPLLVAVNALVFISMIISGVNLVNPTGQDLVRWGANFGPMTMQGEWWRLFSSNFAHFGIVHVLCNLWVLQDLGRLLERMLGGTACLLLYIITGVASQLAGLYVHPEVTSAGASGAIFGLFGALMAFLLTQRGRAPLGLVRPLLNSGLTFLVLNVAIGFSPGSRTDMTAHLGGLVSGFLAGFVLAQPIDSGTAGRRPWRNLLLGVVGVAVVIGAPLLVPPPATEWMTLASDIERVDKEVLDKWNDGVKQVREGRMSERQLGEFAEKEVLPPWREITRRVATMDREPPRGIKERLPRLLDYLRTRQQAWEDYARGIREGNNELLEEGSRNFQRAEQLAKQLQQAP